MRQAGDRDYRGGIAAGQRAGGAQSWHAPGPADQEDEAEKYPPARTSQPVFATELSGRAQPALPASGGGGARLSPPGAERVRVAGRLPSGERAGTEQRLGGALRQSTVSGAEAEPPARPGARQGGSVPVGGRKHRDRISRAKAAVETDLQHAGSREGRAGTVVAVSCSGLRYALSAPHKARRRATLRPLHETGQNKNKQMPNKKKGTFLTR